MEIRKKRSDKVIDIIICKNHWALIEKLIKFSGDHHKNLICRRCLNSYTRENLVKLHKPKCENYDITIFRASSESHFQWKKHFQKNTL